MNIYGIGIDIVKISRFSKLIKKKSYLMFCGIGNPHEFSTTGLIKDKNGDSTILVIQASRTP